MSKSQAFIRRNRAPRVQIEYDLDTNGAKQKINLPFVVGVLSDLAGKSTSNEATGPLEDRTFSEVDIDNFDRYMKKLAPEAAFKVDNKLTGAGKIPVELKFNSLEDFQPAKVADQVDSVKQLVDARKQLEALLAYMGGKSGAEELLHKVLNDPTILKSIADLQKSGETDTPST